MALGPVWASICPSFTVDACANAKPGTAVASSAAAKHSLIKLFISSPFGGLCCSRRARYRFWAGRRIATISDHGAVLAQRIAEVGDRKISRRRSIMQGHRRRHADGLAIGETLRGNAGRGHRFVLGRKTAPGGQKALTGNR